MEDEKRSKDQEDDRTKTEGTKNETTRDEKDRKKEGQKKVFDVFQIL